MSSLLQADGTSTVHSPSRLHHLKQGGGPVSERSKKIVYQKGGNARGIEARHEQVIADSQEIEEVVRDIGTSLIEGDDEYFRGQNGADEINIDELSGIIGELRSEE